MSFSVVCARCGLEYSAVRPVAAAARAGAARHRRACCAEIVRFLRTGRRALEERHARSTLDDFVRIEGYSRFFRDHYLVPFARGALVDRARRRRSTSRPPTRSASSRTTACSGFRRHNWRTVVGGSRRYVPRITAPLGERLRLGARVRAVRATPTASTVRTADDARPPLRRASSSPPTPPQALAMLADADDLERGVLGALPHHPNSTVLHTDARVAARAGARPGRRGTTRWTTAAPRRPRRP